MANSIKGIFVAVELDQTALKKSIDEATKLLKKEFNDTKEVLDESLNINGDKLKTKFKDIAQSIATIQNELKSSGVGRSFFSTALSESTELQTQIDIIAKNAGVSSEKIASSFARAFDASNIENTIKAFNRYVRLLGLSNEEAIKHAKELGIVGEALEKISSKYKVDQPVINIPVDQEIEKTKNSLITMSRLMHEIQNGFMSPSGKNIFSEAISESKELSSAITDIATKSSVSADKLRSNFAKAMETTKVDEMVSSFNNYVRLLGLSNKEAIEHAKELGITGEALDRITQKYNKLNAVSGGESFMTSLKNMVTTGNMMAALQASIATLGANLSIAGGVELGKSMVTTTIQVDSLRTAFEAIYKDGVRANAELDFIRQTTNELGLEFYSTAEAAKGFFAAAQTSDLKNDAEEIFHAFSSAISALKMTDEKGASVFLAISQMLSKGKISAEEMRQQLAEHLPGAVQMLASAMGVSLQKLDKMFESGEVGLENLVLLAREVEKVYGEAGAKAGDALLGQLNKLRSEWTDFKASFVNSDEVTTLIKNVRSAVSSLKDNIDNIKIGLTAVTAGFGAAFSVGVLKGASTALLGIYNLVKETTKELRSGAAASAAFSAGLKASNMSFIGLAGTIGALVTIGTTLWQVWNKGTEKAKYSADDFRNGVNGLSDSFDNLSEKANKSTKDIQNLMKTRLQAQIDQLKGEFQETVNSLPNLADAIRGTAHTTDLYWMLGKAGDVSLGDWQKQQSVIRGVADEFDNLFAMIKDGQTDLDYIPSYLEDIKLKLKNAGLEGSEAWTIANNAMLIFSNSAIELPNKIQALQSAMGGLVQVAKQLENTNPFQLFGNANDLKLENLKKEVALSGDKELSTVVNYLTSGNVKNREGKKPEIDADLLKGAIEVYKSSGLDLKNFLQKQFGLTEDITDELERQTVLNKRLEDQRKSGSKSLSNRVRLEEDYAATLSGLMAKYNEMQKFQGLPMDSLERSLVEVDIRATELDTKLEKLKNKMVKDKVDPKTMSLIELYSKKVNEGEKQEDLAKTYQSFVEQAKSAWNEVAEANGLTNQIILDDTQKTYDDMEKALNKMYAMGRITAEEYAAYMIGINEQVARKKLELDKSWEAGLKQGAQDMKDEVSDYAKQWADVGKSAFTDLGNALADFATNTKKSWKDLGDAFSDLAQSILNNITKIATQTMASNLYSGLFGGASGDGLLSGFVSSLGSLFFADGGVMPTGTLSAYSNGVYSSPTYFSMTGAQRFAKGGVFGEAGPEAIMPLTTMPNGRLGVAATGMGGDVQINIINSTGEKVSTRQSNSSSGGKTIDVMIGDVVAKQMSTPGTKLNRSVSAQTGAKQQVVRR